jgi:3-hydroxyisobutyrate dehydrogenase-like beta-hydroxyacid dehydrogenase
MTNPAIPLSSVAVVGLGNLGGAMAGNLARCGVAVTGYDVDPAARTRAEAAGVTVHDSIAAAVGGVGAIVTSLPTEAVALSAITGPEGVVAGSSPGMFLIETSTIGRGVMLQIAEAGSAAGLRVIDCPVSGGPPEALRGAVVCVVGGEERDVEEIRPLLELMGSSIFVSGPVGSAKAVKLVNNLMAHATVLICAEAFQIGVASGVEPQRLFEMLSQMAGGKNHHFLKRFPLALADDFEARFSIRLAEKDVRLGLELAQTAGVPAPAASLVRSLYAIAAAEGFAEDDIVALLKLYRGWTAS